MRVEVYVEAEVKPSEDAEKVRRAVENVFEGDLEAVLDPDGSGRIQGRGGIEVLNRLKDTLKREQIRDAARKHLTSLMEGDRLIFYLNKQVAYVNHVSFCKPEGESPLGPIRFEVSADDPKSVVGWLTKPG